MRRGSDMSSTRQRAASRETHKCPYCSQSGYWACWNISLGNCRMGNMCSRSNLTECTLCTVCSRPLCGASLAFVFGTLSRLFRTSSVRGNFSHRAQIQEQTTLRSMPPSVSEVIVRLTTKASGARQRLMGIQGASPDQQLASLPMRMGGLGLRSATRCAGGAYWASWANALPMIRDRIPQIAQLVVTSLSTGGCFGEFFIGNTAGRLPSLTHRSGKQPC